ncbi:DUF373 family protein [Candidatus Halobonum tyrrellensis]|uniref:DUF373 family protein n=1 Tax=Candidatus Halobonum tyrrellensis G22 TaxID=1324957 RepID=V4HFW2_9EURY|nr:DUF373 family protein [Candidatus Halobonum tyrrellensis]ESP88993.1 hypothetical protein K933_06073 [Candidatus Halobonum tyrrellensis G22]
MTTLVLCVDRSNDVGRKAGVATPVVGWEAVRSLVTDLGLADPEDAGVNCLLESLHVARQLSDGGEEAVVAVVSGDGDSPVRADRALAAQLDEVCAAHEVESAIVVIDSAGDERAVPIVESRLPVDSVDRVVVRQARDLESTYYLLKQFMADEELRETVLVPVGIGLIILPVLLLQFSTTVALAGVASLLGATLLYYGLGVDEVVERTPERAREALYSGQVAVVTYVVALGLTLVGVFLGGLGASASTEGEFVAAMRFVYDSVPWLAVAALTASLGRLLDELIRDEGVRTSYLNLPFGALAVGLVVRGFAGYFLEREAGWGALELLGVPLSPVQRLALFIAGGLVLALVGVRVATSVSDETLDEVIDDEAETNPGAGNRRGGGD